MSVAIPIPLLQHLPDVNVTPAVGVDEYALTYDHGTASFVLRAPFDHTQYALLAGRAGGQTLYGGTGANDDITIHGTSDGTRATSYIYLQPTAGNVGIGASTDLLHKLTIGVGTNTVAFEGSAGVPYGGFGWDHALDALVIKVNTGANDLNASPLVVQRTTGNVGIGTTAPGSNLEVNASSFDLVKHILTVKGGGTSGAYGFSVQSGSGDSIFKTDNLSYNVTMAVVAGNVGIGDASPVEKLDVTGNINTTGVVKVDDVQVLSNRVIDARCADVANSGDATTDGLIDALRDALVTHGLIAAA